MTDTPFRLNPALDAQPHAAYYAANRMVQIPNVFEPETANEIATLLRESIAWRLVYQTPEEGVVQLTQEEIKTIGAEGMRERMTKIMALAGQNFGYCYNAYPMNKASTDGWDPGHPIHELMQLLSSHTFLDFGAGVIGHPAITKIDATATLYTRGSFLTRHVDDGANNERKAAFTLGFNSGWQTDWGGLLMFIDQASTDVTRALIPRFNLLTLFDGRLVHSVSPVSPFAGAGRLTISGWLRDD